MKKSKRGIAVAAVLVTGLVTAMTASGAAAAPRPQATSYNYTLSAYGTYAYVGGVVQSGRSSWLDAGCGTTAGLNRTLSVASVHASPLLDTGAVKSTLTTTATSATASSDIVGAQLLGGLVSANEVDAVSTTTAGSSGNTYSTTGSQFVGLTVAGVPIAGTPAPNTTLTLPGVGKVVLNQQVQTGSTLTVNMIHIYVKTAQAGIPANTNIIVGHAVSGLAPRTIAILSGGASAAQVVASTVLSAGPEFPANVCGDTGGQTRTNSGASLNLPGVLTTGTASDTVTATSTASTVSGRSTSTVQNLSLLSGLVSADTLEAAANASQSGGVVTTSDQGSTFLNLVVNGQSIPANAPANTHIKVGNITVWVHRVINTTNGIDVRAVEIVVQGTNPFGLPTGADIKVARAHMTVFPAS